MMQYDTGNPLAASLINEPASGMMCMKATALNTPAEIKYKYDVVVSMFLVFYIIYGINDPTSEQSTINTAAMGCK